jgi:hypothetical protein
MIRSKSLRLMGASTLHQQLVMTVVKHAHQKSKINVSGTPTHRVAIGNDYVPTRVLL